MDPETPAQVADVLGVLAIAGAVAAVVLLLGFAVPALRARIIEPLVGTATVLALGVAVVATAGSLWFSEAAGFPPCELCWYQRIAMYPLVAVLAVAAWKRHEASGRLIAFVVAGAGLAVNTWHNVVETFPDSGTGGGCDPTNPCTLRWVEGLGFWTIPRLATVCFVLILVLTAVDHLFTDPGVNE
ncbi:MAG: disulfide bond formation protein B [Acidimicrobiales bacterium]|nr:disulfide bond formation protein B [Acidimicrobiales bacterium]